MTTDTRTFYGPYDCARCGKLIAKASYTQGGEEWDYPEGPIYPNTEWVRHNCEHSVPATGPDSTGSARGPWDLGRKDEQHHA